MTTKLLKREPSAEALLKALSEKVMIVQDDCELRGKNYRKSSQYYRAWRAWDSAFHWGSRETYGIEVIRELNRRSSMMPLGSTTRAKAVEDTVAALLALVRLGGTELTVLA